MAPESFSLVDTPTDPVDRLAEDSYWDTVADAVLEEDEETY